MNDKLSQATIMVIDDRPANLNYLLDILSAQGYKVRVFPGGKLALKAAEQNPPDLILLDISMPEINGYEVCILLKAHPVLKTIPVIFISALSDTSEKIKAFACGGVDYITKPFEPAEVNARIATHLQLARADDLKKEIQRRLNIERRYYAQLDNLSHSIIHINQKGFIVYCNPVVETYFGYTRQELIGQPIEVLIQTDARQVHLLHREKYITTPTTRQMSKVKNILALKKDGETLPVDISLSTLYSEKGLLVSAEIRDITEQLQLQNELEMQRRFRDDGFRKTTDGIILTDTDGFILEANPAIEKMLNYPNDEFIGQQIRFIYANEDEYKAIIPNNNTASGRTQNKPIVVKLRRKDTTTLQVEAIGIPVKDMQGEDSGHYYVLRDISERIRMEQEHKSMQRQLVQAQKMEALGQLTGGIAHDFNNILASMMGFTELTQDMLQEEPELDIPENRERMLDYLNEIHASGKRAQNLITQMLTFSRTGNNGTLQTFDIRILLNETIKMLRPMLPASISIKAHISDQIPAVLADPVQVHQLLMNVCINARDAMEGKGRIDIALAQSMLADKHCTACQEAVAGGYLELMVRDTGPGIDAKLMERLFEPFFTTKKAGKGTGMGLAMVHGIIHHHQGHIIVESEVGRGTTFRILFPLISAEVAQRANKPPVAAETPETV